MTKIVYARKRAEDPAQEHLREHKAIWNESVKSLITKLIAFKRGINGKGDSKSGLPVSVIHEPFPHEIGAYLNRMADESLDVISAAHDIITEQDNYSKTRERASSDDGLVSEASWFGSRFYANTIGLWGEPVFKKMLLSSVRIQDNIENLENLLSSSDKTSIPRSVNLANIMLDGSIKNLFNAYNDLPKAESDKPEDGSGPASNSEVKPPETKSETKPEEKAPPSVVSSEKELGFEDGPVTVHDIHSHENEDSIVDILLYRKLYTDVQVHGTVIVNLLANLKKIDRKTARQRLFLDSFKIREEIMINSPEKFITALEKHKDGLEFFKKLINDGSDIKLVPDSISTYQELSSFISMNKIAGPIDFLKRFWFKTKPDFIRKNVEIDDLKKNCLSEISDLDDIVKALMNQIEAKDLFLVRDSMSNLNDKTKIIFDMLGNLGNMYNSADLGKRIQEKDISKLLLAGSHLFNFDRNRK